MLSNCACIADILAKLCISTYVSTMLSSFVRKVLQMAMEKYELFALLNCKRL